LSEKNHISHLCNKIPKVAPPYGNLSSAFVIFEKGLHNNLKRDRVVQVLGEIALKPEAPGQGSFSGGIRVESQQNNKPAAVAKIDFNKSA
jgi:hypothetical protein